MIIKCQVSVSSLLLNIPKVNISKAPHFPACTQSDGSMNKKQSKDLCRGERSPLKNGVTAYVFSTRDAVAS